MFQKSNNQYLVGEQDCDSLKIIMRSIYLQYSANKVGDISKQVRELNQMILNYCIAQVYSEAQGYVKYLYDVSTLAVPISHPVMANNSDRELELKPWF